MSRLGIDRIVGAAIVIVLASAPAAAQLAGQEIHVGVGGPLTTASATFGLEMRNAVEFAVAEKNAGGGILGAHVAALPADDQADNQKGTTVAKGFCDDPADLGV